MKILIAIPTYNERDNIERMIKSVLRLNNDETVKKFGIKINLVIIDDNSPDGTREIVREFMNEKNDGMTGEALLPEYRQSLSLIERKGKMGLGTAYVAAFGFAISKGFDYVITMDCDFSHDPAEIIGFIRLMNTEKCGMIVGSRYKGGIRIINWSIKRLLISYFANIYASFVTGVKIDDLTGGFNMYDVNCLKKINLNGIHSRGYAFQIEMKYRIIRGAGCSFTEYPIIFYERTMGKSKMSNGIIFEAFFGVIKLRLGLYKRFS
ncbi:MAG TPA: polyprenol monophosphomannose synthase [bacterium]|nr:polyprenol monophosphomannose synthase [bacterium]